MRHFFLLCLPALLALPAHAADKAKPASLQMFAARCASCHSIGEGKRVGPDLKGVLDRLSAAKTAAFIQAPSKLLDSDPYFQKLLKEFNGIRMPDFGLTEAQAKDLAELLDVCSKNKCDFSALFKAGRDAEKADIDKGRELFTGELALINGGPPCTDCHTVRGIGRWTPGSKLASDLTHVAGLLGDEGLDERLKKPINPLQAATYSEIGLTEEEVWAVRAFLYDANRFMDEPEARISHAYAGFAGAVLILLLLGGVRRMRRPGGQEGSDV